MVSNIKKVMKLSVSLDVKYICHFGDLNCTTVGQASDSMTALT